MSQFFRQFEIKSFWKQSAMSQSRLQWILEAAEKDSWRAGKPEATEDAKELFSVFDLLSRKREESPQRRTPRIEDGTTMKLFSMREQSSVKIWALAPSAKQTERYENSLSKCFDNERRFQCPPPKDRPDHNIASMALLVEFGDTKLLLGGDVLSSGWKDVLEEVDQDKLSVHFVKVSHHGSQGAYCSGLWESLSRDRKPISVITPYRGPQLPKETGITHIQKFSERVMFPCIDALHLQAVPVEKAGLAVQSHVLLRQKLKATQAGPFVTGRCGFVFDCHGRCVDESISGPAGEI